MKGPNEAELELFCKLNLMTTQGHMASALQVRTLQRLLTIEEVNRLMKVIEKGEKITLRDIGEFYARLGFEPNLQATPIERYETPKNLPEEPENG